VIFLEDQIQTAIKAIKLEKPILKFDAITDDYIKINLNDKPSFDEEAISNIDKIVLEGVRKYIVVKLDLDYKMYTTDIDVRGTIRWIFYSMDSTIRTFLAKHGGYTNNRMSNIYKWYDVKIDLNAVYSNEKLAKDIYNISNFISNNTSESYYKTIRTLLTLIKDEYEPILGPVVRHTRKAK
jgi:hypothetical protein